MKITFAKSLLQRSFFPLAFSLMPFWGNGQVLNIEKNRVEDDTVRKWTGEAVFSFNFRQQQIRSLVFGMESNLTRLGKQHNFSFISDFNIVQAEENDAVSNGFIHFRLHLNKRKKLGQEVFMQYQYDDVLGMNQRALAGVGLRNVSRFSEKISMATGVGVMYEQEDWSFQEVDSTTNFLKSTNYLAFHYTPKKDFSVNFTAYYQSRWNYLFTRPRIICDLTWEFKISSHLTFASTFDILYDSRPVVDIDQAMYGLENAIRLSF